MQHPTNRIAYTMAFVTPVFGVLAGRIIENNALVNVINIMSVIWTDLVSALFMGYCILEYLHTAINIISVTRMTDSFNMQAEDKILLILTGQWLYFIVLISGCCHVIRE